MLKSKFITILTFFNFYLNSNIIIRDAIKSDNLGFINLNTQVHNEIFKEILIKYAHLKISENPELCINDWLEKDKKAFKQVFKDSSKGLLLAHDTIKNKIVGASLFKKKKNDVLEIELLIVAKNYRGKNLGKKLVLKSISHFKDIKSCILYTFTYHNENSINFYKSLGFEDLGISKKNKIIAPYNTLHSDLFSLFKLNLN